MENRLFYSIVLPALVGCLLGCTPGTGGKKETADPIAVPGTSGPADPTNPFYNNLPGILSGLGRVSRLVRSKAVASIVCRPESCVGAPTDVSCEPISAQSADQITGCQKFLDANLDVYDAYAALAKDPAKMEAAFPAAKSELKLPDLSGTEVHVSAKTSRGKPIEVDLKDVNGWTRNEQMLMVFHEIEHQGVQPEDGQPLHDNGSAAGYAFPGGGRLKVNAITRSIALLDLLYASQAGKLDRSFGPAKDGLVTLSLSSLNDMARGAAAFADGSLVMMGFTHIGAAQELFLSKLLVDGTADKSFGSPTTPGTIFTEFPAAVLPTGIRALPGGQLLVVGYSAPQNTSGRTTYTGIVRRFGANGALDSSFHLTSSTPAIVTSFTTYQAVKFDGFNIGGQDNVPLGATIQPDGAILIYGYTGTYPDVGGYITRFSSTGALETAFGGGNILAVCAATPLDGGEARRARIRAA